MPFLLLFWWVLQHGSRCKSSGLSSSGMIELTVVNSFGLLPSSRAGFRLRLTVTVKVEVLTPHPGMGLFAHRAPVSPLCHGLLTWLNYLTCFQVTFLPVWDLNFFKAHYFSTVPYRWYFQPPPTLSVFPLDFQMSVCMCFH